MRRKRVPACAQFSGWGRVEQNFDIWNRGDEPILDLLAAQSAPPGTIEVMSFGVSKTALADVSAAGTSPTNLGTVC